MASKRRLAAAFVLIAALSACSLPRGAAMQGEILRNANAQAPTFAHYEVDSKLLTEMTHWPSGKTGGKSRSWISGGAGGRGQILTAGDSVQISVWEGGENKLLTNPGVPASEIPVTLISPSGTIFVPYIGAVKVAGLSPEAARETVQEQVSKLIPEAQVQLSASPGKSNSVSIIGGVVKSGTVPLVDRSLTVLGLISEGGGVLPSIDNPQLRLQRGGKVYETSLQRVLDDPALDAGLRPGDKVFVETDKRSFLSLGAAGAEKIIPFPKDRVTALEAVTLAGGINDSRANPKGVLILREYPPAAVRSVATEGPSNARVVFSMNLTTADGLFSAQNFTVEPNDLVLATESSVTNTRTILGLFGTTLGLANTADRLSD